MSRQPGPGPVLVPATFSTTQGTWQLAPHLPWPQQVLLYVNSWVFRRPQVQTWRLRHSPHLHGVTCLVSAATPAHTRDPVTLQQSLVSSVPRPLGAARLLDSQPQSHIVCPTVAESLPRSGTSRGQASPGAALPQSTWPLCWLPRSSFPLHRQHRRDRGNAAFIPPGRAAGRDWPGEGSVFTPFCFSAAPTFAKTGLLTLGVGATDHAWPARQAEVAHKQSWAEGPTGRAPVTGLLPTHVRTAAVFPGPRSSSPVRSGAQLCTVWAGHVSHVG